MADTPASPASPSPVEQSASDTAIFAKFIDQHAASVAAELEGADGNAQNSGRGAAGAARVGAPAARPAADAPRVQPGRANARGDGRDGGGERAANDTGAATAPRGADGSGDADAEPGEADDEAAKAPEAQPAALTEADAIALARKAHAAGDMNELDRALKAILPGSKGLSEFAVDGKRYGEFRVITSRERKKLDARAGELDGREANLKRGMALVEQLVARYQPFEQLVQALDKDDAEAFAEQFEKVAKRSLNDVVRRDLDRKLGKKSDPEVDALRRELRAEKEAREARERKEQEALAHRERATQIQGHLNFLTETLGQHSDARVSALVSTPEGLREIFLEQKAAYDPRTRSTITPEKAALNVIERKAKELEPWQRVLGRGSSPPAVITTTAEEKREPSAPPTPRALPLGSSGGAAASAGGRKLSDNELFDKYERLHKIGA